ncbi:MAG: bifunctional phosphopantothenoylcysteine decarboxylase/phosphopantothenate--cysteine ligase CoaBC [Chloroflexi bacterium]|nr:bifunctional phosphopantothenoylcysteine decarboxylase/phosphopantothenate--cysteine ligase CoaBC [Chloroflexota bacterium]
MLKDKTVVLGVTGSIAAYKAADIASKLAQSGAKVLTVMTGSAREFVTPLTFRSVTGQPVITDMFDSQSQFSVQHVSLADMADAILIAPATAQIMAKLVAGLADDMISLTVLATKAPVVIAPAMDHNMWESPVTQNNVTRLRARGFTIVGPGKGHLASGKEGWGRLEDTEKVLGALRMTMGRKGDLLGRRFVVTAGGTQEPIDPVRVITNRSSGKMGYAIAEAARDRGAEVTLVTAPTALAQPVGINTIPVNTAREMNQAVAKAVLNADVLIMAAAVADYQVASPSLSKIKKEATGRLTLELERTPDILGETKGSFLRVGFAAESEGLVRNAAQKLKSKALDLIVANDITQADSGFGTDTNRVVIIDRAGSVEALPLLTKYEVAERILDRVNALSKV